MYTILLKQETPTNANATGTFASFWHVCETLIEALSCSLWDCFWGVKVPTAANATNETRQHGIAWNQTSLGLTNKHFQPKPDPSINKTPRWTSANQPQNSQSIRKALQKKNAKPAPLERFPHETQWCASLWLQLFWPDLTTTKTRFRSPLLKFFGGLQCIGVVAIRSYSLQSTVGGTRSFAQEAEDFFSADPEIHRVTRPDLTLDGEDGSAALEFLNGKKAQEYTVYTCLTCFQELYSICVLQLNEWGCVFARLTTFFDSTMFFPQGGGGGRWDHTIYDPGEFPGGAFPFPLFFLGPGRIGKKKINRSAHPCGAP